MPLYEFYCRNCRNQYEAAQSIAEHTKALRPACPTCGSPDQVEARLSAFFAQTSRKA
jgi:putative FmdB family regulatory protein